MLAWPSRRRSAARVSEEAVMPLGLVGILVAGLGAAPPAPASAGELRATFIGNMAFHITDGRVAVLIDFPYQSGAFGYMQWSEAMVPKGPAPLCLISHSHDDHFAPRRARDFCAMVLGPKDVVSASGVTALALGTDVAWEGLSIRPQATPHDGVEHYSYLVVWGGRRLYFTGDTDDTAALLGARGLDVAFVSPWLLKAVAGQGKKIDAAQVVVYHHKTGEVVPEIQGRLLPRQGDVLGLGPGSKPVRVIQAGPDVMPTVDERDEFEKRLQDASANIESPDGRAYFDGAFSKQFYAGFGPRLSECMQRAADTTTPSFDLVLDLGADGRVQEAMVRPETKTTTCFTALTRTDVFPPPPRAGFRVPISMRFAKP
jgi:L-ascorbate metabolism protein UlaG (beta-lactamase superfamily)